VGKNDETLPGTAPDRSAGVPPAVSGASRPRFGEVTIRDRGRLPHWEKESGTYFITFRLADPLPKSVLEKIAGEREDILRTAAHLKRDLFADERTKVRRLSTKVIEEYLDRGAGTCRLRDSALADEVAHALCHFDGQRYRLFAWCIMPNHVHVVVRILPSWTLASILHSWKSFSAKRANQVLRSHEAFWQREYYDHLIRDEGEFVRSIRYVAENPAKARLENWPWVWVCGRDAPTTAGEDAGGTKP
jgi:REP element-mobilizing transposase RayT